METFEFNGEWLPQNIVDIDNTGNFALEAQNDLGMFWFLIVRTLLGNSEILSFGPIDIDSDKPLDSYECSYNNDEYNERKLNKTIRLWLNDRVKHLIDARPIEISEALSHMPDMHTFMTTSVLDIIGEE